MRERELREEICEIGRRLYARGLVAGSEGNISARLGPDTVLCTPTMVSKGYMSPDDLAIVDLEGRQTSGDKARSSEALVHLSVYKHRPDVQAVIHSHPPHATAFAVTHTEVPLGAHPELDLFLGPVPLVPYELTGTQRLADAVVPYLNRTSALLLANHGSVTWGPTLERAWFATEILDGYCRLLLHCKSLGPVKSLTPRQVAEILELKKRYGWADPRLPKK
jgi:L-fuculose-phosphate aldolase